MPRPRLKSFLKISAIGLSALIILPLIFATGGIYLLSSVRKGMEDRCVSERSPVPTVPAESAPTTDYYELLTDNCCGDSCCYKSVKVMETIHATLAQTVNETSGQSAPTCPNGKKTNTLLCQGAYTWCE